jgi:hypothetical protein
MVAMNTQDIINMGRKAKSETEDFINRHLNDRAKGWPLNSLWNTTYDETGQEQRIRKRAVFQT